MSRSEPHRNESLYQGITTWAASAPSGTLGVLVASSLAGVGAILAIDWHRWPVAGLLVTIASIGGWGLVDHRAARPLGRPARVAKAFLLGVGTVAALLGGLGLLFWLMGPAPIL